MGSFPTCVKVSGKNPHVSRKLSVVLLLCVRMELWHVTADLLSVKCEIKVALKF